MPKAYRHLVAFYASRAVSEYLKECRKVVDSMSNNPYFPKPSPPLSEVTTRLDELEKAELTAHNGPAGSVAARDIALVTTRADMRQLRSYIQAVSDADVSHGREIIESSRMYVGMTRLAGKDPLSVRSGAARGEATILAKARRGRVVYHWQMSENGTDFGDLPPTLVSTTQVEGLTVGKTYHFRFRTFTTDGFSDWSPAIPYLAR
jgi:hypothetical protein